MCKIIVLAVLITGIAAQCEDPCTSPAYGRNFRSLFNVRDTCNKQPSQKNTFIVRKLTEPCPHCAIKKTDFFVRKLSEPTCNLSPEQEKVFAIRKKVQSRCRKGPRGRKIIVRKKGQSSWNRLPALRRCAFNGCQSESCSNEAQVLKDILVGQQSCQSGGCESSCDGVPVQGEIFGVGNEGYQSGGCESSCNGVPVQGEIFVVGNEGCQSGGGESSCNGAPVQREVFVGRNPGCQSGGGESSCNGVPVQREIFVLGNEGCQSGRGESSCNGAPAQAGVFVLGNPGCQSDGQEVSSNGAPLQREVLVVGNSGCQSAGCESSSNGVPGQREIFVIGDEGCESGGCGSSCNGAPGQREVFLVGNQDGQTSGCSAGCCESSFNGAPESHCNLGSRQGECAVLRQQADACCDGASAQRKFLLHEQQNDYFPNDQSNGYGFSFNGAPGRHGSLVLRSHQPSGTDHQPSQREVLMLHPQGYQSSGGECPCNLVPKHCSNHGPVQGDCGIRQPGAMGCNLGAGPDEILALQQPSCPHCGGKASCNVAPESHCDSVIENRDCGFVRQQPEPGCNCADCKSSNSVYNVAPESCGHPAPMRGGSGVIRPQGETCCNTVSVPNEVLVLRQESCPHCGRESFYNVAPESCGNPISGQKQCILVREQAGPGCNTADCQPNGCNCAGDGVPESCCNAVPVPEERVVVRQQGETCSCSIVPESGSNPAPVHRVREQADPCCIAEKNVFIREPQGCPHCGRQSPSSVLPESGSNPVPVYRDHILVHEQADPCCIAETNLFIREPQGCPHCGRQSSSSVVPESASDPVPVHRDHILVREQADPCCIAEKNVFIREPQGCPHCGHQSSYSIVPESGCNSAPVREDRILVRAQADPCSITETNVFIHEPQGCPHCGRQFSSSIVPESGSNPVPVHRDHILVREQVDPCCIAEKNVFIREPQDCPHCGRQSSYSIVPEFGSSPAPVYRDHILVREQADPCCITEENVFIREPQGCPHCGRQFSSSIVPESGSSPISEHRDNILVREQADPCCIAETNVFIREPQSCPHCGRQSSSSLVPESGSNPVSVQRDHILVREQADPCCIAEENVFIREPQGCPHCGRQFSSSIVPESGCNPVPVPRDHIVVREQADPRFNTQKNIFIREPQACLHCGRQSSRDSAPVYRDCILVRDPADPCCNAAQAQEEVLVLRQPSCPYCGCQPSCSIVPASGCSPTPGHRESVLVREPQGCQCCGCDSVYKAAASCCNSAPEQRKVFALDQQNNQCSQSLCSEHLCCEPLENSLCQGCSPREACQLVESVPPHLSESAGNVYEFVGNSCPCCGNSLVRRGRQTEAESSESISAPDSPAKPKALVEGVDNPCGCKDDDPACAPLSTSDE